MNGKQEINQLDQGMDMDANERDEGSNSAAKILLPLFHQNILMSSHILSKMTLFLCLTYILATIL